MYDGFISYSHAADDLLAPRLQAGLQRFAKPWWKRRALRIFRDESSLSANPHLWSSITEALDDSEWFVLLLSPDAARSPWVNQEIEYWRHHRNPERILPVLTDGDFAWDAGDVSGDAVPDQLRGIYNEEPRWVDLRFARDEEQLDLKDPRFASAVADIASAVHGVPKDQLASEEVRQHRRTIRSAWAAGAALLILAVTSVGFAVQSANNAGEAELQAIIAADQADRANTEADRATEEAERANTNAQLAEAGRLAARAVTVLEEDPELSVLLGIRALTLDPGSRDTVDALTEALQAHRTTFVGAPPPGFGGQELAVGSISPDGSLVTAYFLPANNAAPGVIVWETTNPEQPLWVEEFGEEVFDSLVYFTADGAHIVVTSTRGLDNPDMDWFVFDARTGEKIHTIKLPCRLAWFAGPAQNGPYIDLSRPILLAAVEEGDEGCDHTAPSADLMKVNLWTGEEEPVGTGPTTQGSLAGMPTLSEAGDRLAVAGSGPGAVIDLETDEVLLDLPGGLSSLSPDGSFVLTSNAPLELWSVDERRKLRDYPGRFSVAWFSKDGSMVYGSTFEGNTLVFDRETGLVLYDLRGHGGRQINVQMSADNTRLGTFSADDTVRVWNIGSPLVPTGATPAISVGGGPGAFFAFQNLWSTADEIWGTVYDEGQPTTQVLDPVSGDEMRRLPVGAIAISPDGTLVAHQATELVDLSDNEANGPGTGGAYSRFGAFVVADADTGEPVVELEGICDHYLPLDDGEIVTAPECTGYPGPWFDFTQVAAFSPDSSMFAMTGWVSGNQAVWDAATGEMLYQREGFGNVLGEHIEFSIDGRHVLIADESKSERGQPFGVTVISVDTWEEEAFVELTQPLSEMKLTPDGSLLVGGDWNSDVVLIDTSTWTEVERLDGQQGGQINDIAVSPNGRLVATAGGDNQVWVWDLETRQAKHKFPLPRSVWGLRNVDWIDDETVLVSFRTVAVTLTLNPETMRATAVSTLTRSFTEQECATYDIEPCPTLDEMREG